MKEKHLTAYMKCAEAFAECSPAVRLKVGSVLVKNNRIISCGYNALPEHIVGDCETKIHSHFDHIHDGELQEYPHQDNKGDYRLVTRAEVRHSERNCLKGLEKSNESSLGSIMFTTHSCCLQCAIDIVDAGVVKFFYRNVYRDTEGLDYLKTNGVEVEQI